MMGCPLNNIMIPVKNAKVPFSFSIWKKNENVFLKPIRKQIPAKNINCHLFYLMSMFKCYISLIFFNRVKKFHRFFIILTFPIANNPLSKSSTIPRNMNAMPIPVKPRPICVLVLISIIFVIL